jgi:transposase
MKTGFILHLDSLSVLDELTNEQAGILFKAIRDYNLGKEPELDFAMRMAFIPFKNQFERDLEKYNNTCERNRNNGSKGGRPKKANETQETQVVFEKPKKADNKNDNKNDNDINYQALLEFVNKTFDRNFKVVNDSVKKKYKSLLKQGYSKEQITNAIKNCKSNKYHIENNYQYCTLEFFSRAETIDKYSDVSEIDNSKVYTPNIIHE